MSALALLMAAAGLGSGAAPTTYVDDVFSAYMYTGNGAAQTIPNGVNTKDYKALFISKRLSGASTTVPSALDNVRVVGTTDYVLSMGTRTDPEVSVGDAMTYLASGFTINDGYTGLNGGADGPFVAHTFRSAEKFFDIVTWTGDGAASRAIPHGLGVAPGFSIAKSRSASGIWATQHRSIDATTGVYYALNTTNAGIVNNAVWNSTQATATHLTVGSSYNAAGVTYVAYLWAHDPAPDGKIRCGSFEGGSTLVNLGWEPQYLLYRNLASGNGWQVLDTARRWDAQFASTIALNSAANEVVSAAPVLLGDEGFVPSGLSGTFVYMAIRRSTKPPTDASKVFFSRVRPAQAGPVTQTGVPFAPDMVLRKSLGSNNTHYFWDKRRGEAYVGPWVNSPESVMAGGATGTGGVVQFTSDGYIAGSFGTSSSARALDCFFKRAAGFFDQVLYTGTGAARTVRHNLAVAPELVIVKRRDAAGYWVVGAAPLAADRWECINNRNNGGDGTGAFNARRPTAAEISLGTNAEVNALGGLYFAYLFASAPGVSKIGSYVGNGGAQNVDCGFTTGARFILIVRLGAAAPWFVWDAARGIVANADPYFELGDAFSEITTDDGVDPLASGFVVNQTAATGVNVAGATYLFWAIA
jgi:hypothetical protein